MTALQIRSTEGVAASMTGRHRLGVFATRIKELRLSAGMTQQAFAHRCQVAEKTVRRWESNDGVPSITQLKAICEDFGVSADWLMGVRYSAPGRDYPAWELFEGSDLYEQLTESQRDDMRSYRVTEGVPTIQFYRLVATAMLTGIVFGPSRQNNTMVRHGSGT